MSDMAYAMERNFRAGAETDTPSASCGNGVPPQKATYQASKAKLGSQTQKRNYNHFKYTNIYSHIPHMYTPMSQISSRSKQGIQTYPIIYSCVSNYLTPIQTHSNIYSNMSNCLIHRVQICPTIANTQLTNIQR